jgi:hypothetical protein
VNELQERIEELERERDVWRRLAGELRIEELERERDDMRDWNRRSAAAQDKLTAERDEARRLAEQLRDEVIVQHEIGRLLSYPDLRLPWEESE